MKKQLFDVSYRLPSKPLLLTSFLLISFAPSCKKEISCYNPQMEKEHPGICLQDCPGVCGCDGFTYCNECIANSKGIEVVQNQPCQK